MFFQMIRMLVYVNIYLPGVSGNKQQLVFQLAEISGAATVCVVLLVCISCRLGPWLYCYILHVWCLSEMYLFINMCVQIYLR